MIFITIIEYSNFADNKMMRRSKQSKNNSQTQPSNTLKTNHSITNTKPSNNFNHLEIPQKKPNPSSQLSPQISNIQEMQAIKKIGKDNDPLKEKLKKEFKKFSYLPFQDLKKISESMALYIEEKKKNMDHKDGQFVRFSFRNQILKILLVTVLQLTIQKAKPLNPLQQKLFDSNCNRLEIIVIIAHNLQCYLYEELFNPKETKPRLEPYQCQIKLLITNLYDINNLSLRRGILNGTISYEFIKSATEQQMMSEQTKRKERERMIQEVRQSQVWEERQFNKINQSQLQNSAQTKEKEERKLNRRWASQKVDEMKHIFDQMNKTWRRRQKDLEGYYGKFKRYNQNKFRS